jgi:hypothetical protein
MKRVCSGLILAACAAFLSWGCAPQEEPAAEITGVGSADVGGGPAATQQDYMQRQVQQQKGMYSSQSGYPGSKSR